MVQMASIVRPLTRAALTLQRRRRRKPLQKTFCDWTPYSLPLSRSHSSSSHFDGDAEEYDIVIVGGGVIGSVMADQILRHGPGMRMALVEAGSGPTALARADDLPHPRSYALSPASIQFLFGGGDPDERYFSRNSGFYTSMQVWEAQQPASIVWTTQDLDGSKDGSRYLGWCLEDFALQQYLWKERLISERLTIYPSTLLTEIQWPAKDSNSWVEGTLSPSHGDSAEDTAFRKPIRARLIIAADGSHSSIRASAGISMQKYDYHQTAVTFTVQFDERLGANRQRAFQRFLSNGGPMALLPTHSSQHGILVWSSTADEAQYWVERITANKGNEQDLVDFLNSTLQTGPERLPPLLYDPQNSGRDILSQAWQGLEHIFETVQYGTAMAGQQQANHSFVAPPQITNIASRLHTFPLTCQIPESSQYTQGTHLALIGDAAHVVHPMAGQGLNLGLHDVRALTVCLEKAICSGMDVGTFLHEYNLSRQVQVSATIAGIHGLQRLFSNTSQSPISKHIKSLGMNGIQNVPWIRQKIAQAACYGVV